jgi:trehalose 6-phosphate synthase
MRLSIRFLIPLVIALAAIAIAVEPLVGKLTTQWFVRDLEIRSALITNTLQEPLAELVRERSRARTAAFLERVIQDERVFALALCDNEGKTLYSTPNFPAEARCESGASSRASQVLDLAVGPLHVAVNPIRGANEALGALVIAHDMSFVKLRSADSRRYLIYLFAAIAAVVALITVVIAEISWRGWVAGVRELISGGGLRRPGEKPPAPALRPFVKDLEVLLRDLDIERRSRDESQMTWRPEALRRILREDLKGDEILIVSNREPYSHHRDDEGKIRVQRPASGLVTALEPVMRACSGTWIAHGGGNADRETVDEHDHVMVPPDKPSYRIRRVWLTKEEEEGYYYGFANEGLWPLCHVAHTRPVFRKQDWDYYQDVNQRFADIVVEEAHTENPIVLVQDYHFALLPRMVRNRLPNATIITFWHIPWTNPESFGILPWRTQVLEGLLGSSILGFHTQSHCNNFFDTVDRYLEARIDRETFNITFGGEQTEVRRYPISIEWPPAALANVASVDKCRKTVRERLGMSSDRLLGVGVDRLDYTKGILERFNAVERLLELQPEWIGKFSFVQAAAPSRSTIHEYQDFDARVRALADRINARFGGGGYEPIVLKVEQHPAEAVYELYRAADLCYVSSLHDGMNLVAKEFVAARDDECGVLILSQFTGASRELAEALIVNPYDIDQAADAMNLALTMPPEEERARMRSMRNLVMEFNVFRWAGRMLMDAARMRQRRRMKERGEHGAQLQEASGS